MIIILKLFKLLIVQPAKFAAQQPLIEPGLLVGVSDLFVAIVFTENVGGQFYIDLVSGNSKIVEMAANHIEGVPAGFVQFGRVDGDAGNNLVRRNHIQHIEVFDCGASVAGVAMVTIVKAASHFNRSGVKRHNSFNLEILDAILSPASVDSENSCRLAWYNVAERPFHFSGESISRPLVHPL